MIKTTKELGLKDYKFFKDVEFTDLAWQDYCFHKKQNKAILKKINKLIDDIGNNGHVWGIGKPEPLKFGLQKYWSRRIDAKNRLVYRIENNILEILICSGHYFDK